ncbi:Ig-like domain-containing protein, partial [Pseudorhodobacter sp.]|uniref:Ig-like domain-containing protein n=1 Tax=Pseudorhodobacter sp. TaxID=1934400 RepID=UPI002649CBB7
MLVETHTPDVVSFTHVGEESLVKFTGAGSITIAANRSDIERVERIGDDLLIHLKNGEMVRVENYFTTPEHLAIYFADGDAAGWELTNLTGTDQLQMTLSPVGLGGFAGAGLTAIGLGAAGASMAAALMHGGKGGLLAPTVVVGTGNADGTLGVTGTGVPGATVTLTFPNGEVVTALVDVYGNYVASSSTPQPDGDVTATQVDQNGEGPSAEARDHFDDSMGPLAPTVEAGAGNADGTLGVTGTGEPGATVTLTFPNGEVVTVLVDADGNYAASSSTVQPDGDVTATQVDQNGEGP